MQKKQTPMERRNQVSEYLIQEMIELLADRMLERDVICKLFPTYGSHQDDFFIALRSRHELLKRSIKLSIDPNLVTFKHAFGNIFEKLSTQIMNSEHDYQRQQERGVDSDISATSQQAEEQSSIVYQSPSLDNNLPTLENQANSDLIEDFAVNPSPPNNKANQQVSGNEILPVPLPTEKPALASPDAVASEKSSSDLTQSFQSAPSQSVDPISDTLLPQEISMHVSEALEPAGVAVQASMQETQDLVEPSQYSTAKPPGENKVGTFRLPNARVGLEYLFSLETDLFELDAQVMRNLSVDASHVIGLSWDADSRSLRGKPEFAGEFSLPVSLQLSTDGQQRPSELLRTLLLTVNPDPRSLWKQLPSDPGILYYKKDRDHKTLPNLSYEQNMVLAASQRGRSHAHVGSCRDDDFTIASLAGGWLLMAVADGAGSARYSRQGSKIACEQAEAYLKERLSLNDFAAKLREQVDSYASSASSKVHKHPPHELKTLFYELLPNAALKGRKAIEQEAVDRAKSEPETAAKDYATTLQLCLIQKLEAAWFFCAFAIGDGMTAVYAPEHGGIHLLADPDSGEFSGQTRFLTMGSVWSSADSLFQRLKFLLIPDFEACMLMTDGVTDPKFASDQAMQDTHNWQLLWEDLAQKLTQPDTSPEMNLLEWLNFWSDGEHDDRTLAVLTGTFNAR